MVKIGLVILAVLSLFITFFALWPIVVTKQNVTKQNLISTIDLNPKSDVLVIPLAIGINPLDNRLYILTINEDSGTNEIVVIDSLSNDVIDTITLPGYHYSVLTHIEVNPETKRIYIANSDSNNKIHVINGITNKIIMAIEIEDGVEGITINTVTNKIYAVNNKMATVTVIDGKTNKKTDVIKLQDDIGIFFDSGGIKVNPFNNRIYVLKDSTRKKSTNTTAILKDGLGLPRVRFIPGDETIKGKEIIVIDGSTKGIIKRVKLDFDALSKVIDEKIINNTFFHKFSASSGIVIPEYKIEINPTINRIYINVSILNLDSYGLNSLLVMDGVTNNIIEAINVDLIQGSSGGITVNPATNRIYLNDLWNNKVKVIDGSSNQVISEFKTDDQPSLIKVDPFTNRIYIGSNESGKVTIKNDN